MTIFSRNCWLWIRWKSRVRGAAELSFKRIERNINWQFCNLSPPIGAQKKMVTSIQKANTYRAIQSIQSCSCKLLSFLAKLGIKFLTGGQKDNCPFLPLSHSRWNQQQRRFFFFPRREVHFTATTCTTIFWIAKIPKAWCFLGLPNNFCQHGGFVARIKEKKD